MRPSRIRELVRSRERIIRGVYAIVSGAQRGMKSSRITGKYARYELVCSYLLLISLNFKRILLFQHRYIYSSFLIYYALSFECDKSCQMVADNFVTHIFLYFDKN